jgi:hypothetical protein
VPASVVGIGEDVGPDWDELLVGATFVAVESSTPVLVMAVVAGATGPEANTGGSVDRQGCRLRREP